MRRLKLGSKSSDGVQKLVNVDRLENALAGAHLDKFFLVTLLQIGCEDDHRQEIEGAVLSDTAQDAVAIKPWHMEVEQDDVEFPGGDRFQAGFAIGD